MANKIIVTEKDIVNVLKKCISEADRHREGYYQEYAERTGKKDRHSPDYYKKYRERKKQENSQAENANSIPVQQKPKKRISRKEYYRKYNQAHPERLNRGFTKGYKNGNVANGTINNNPEIFPGVRIIGYDEIGRPITNDPLGDAIRNKGMEWHDDDWEESGWND